MGKVLKIKSTRYVICDRPSQVKEVVRRCKKTRYCSLDFETFAQGPHGISYDNDEDKKLPCGPQYKEDKPSCISISYQPYTSYVIPLSHFESPFKGKTQKILNYLSKHIFENRKVVKVGFNLKFELRWLLRYGCTFKGMYFDVMLAKYLLDEERPNDLKSLVAQKIPDYAGYEDDIDIALRKYRGWANIPLKILAPYNAMDSDVTLRLLYLLEKKLIKNGFYKLFRNMCSQQIKVLAESEHMGMLVDRKYLNNIIGDTAKEIERQKGILLSHKKLKGFQKWREQKKIKKLINEVKEDIERVKADKTKTPQQMARLISNREQKISRYIAGQLVSKKEVVGEFNPNSPDQMVDFLYLSKQGLNLPIPHYTKDKITKQPTDRPSTDEDALTELKVKDKSGFIAQLLEYRGITKLYSTYMVAMEYRLTPSSRIHGSFLIHGTVTGRLSSKNPNLQNIPRDTTSSLIKKMFICPPGHVLLEIDYGQAELRIAAELSGDEAMIEIFRKGYNIHVATACKMNKCFDRYEEIKAILKDPTHKDFVHWEKQKKKGKTLNFSILYLQSDEETAKQMTFEFGYEVTKEEAAEYKEDWFQEFPKIRVWMKQQEKFVRKHGYVYNLFGRKRRLPDIFELSKGKQNKAIRDAVNAPIQGASSDFTQLSCIEIREKILSQEIILTDYVEYIPQCYTVHDSIGFYIQPKYIHEAVPKIVDIMANTMTLKYFGFEMKKVKMKASPEIGINWGSLEEYDPKKDYTKLLKQ